MARPDNHNDCPNCCGCDCGIVPFTPGEQLLLEAIIKHDKESKKSGMTFGSVAYPKASHCGMSVLRDFQSGKLIKSNFQKRTFESLTYNRGVLTQTMYMGYRLSDEFDVELYEYSKQRKEVTHG